MPTIELAEAATVYGSKHAVPVVLDMRDLWPDIFVEVAPSVLKAPVWLMSRRSDARLKACVQKADAVWGITPEFVEWGLGKAGRPAREGDASFWLGLSSELPSEDKVLAAQASWEAKGIRESDGFINLCFFGVMSNKLDMETVIDAAKRIEKSHPKVRFVLCGTGDHLADYRALAKGLANVVFPGWVNAPEIRCLMHRSVAALAPYRSRRDFMISIPTKAIEYLSAGLPLLSSLRGSLERLVSETRTGLSYANGDAAGLASAIRTLVEDRALRDEFALNARRTFEQSFVGEGINDAMRSCLHTVRYEYEKRTQASLRAGSTILTPSR
jgi:glycosyltransferase involved in cell wall biosynthesis